MTRPIRVLELRSARGSGGGPEKTILLGAARSDPARFAVTVCYLRDLRDREFTIDARARQFGVDYVEVPERHSFDPRVWPALCRLVRDHSIDIIHAHDYKTDWLTYLLARATGAAPLATVHGWTGVSWREQIYYKLDHWLLTKYPLLVAVSGVLRSELIAAGARPERVRTILNGIDPAAFRRDPGRVAAARAVHGVKPGEFVIGTLCRLDPEKRVDLLLEAFARVRSGRPGLRLLIAGEGSERPALEAAAARLALGDSCRFLGHCADVVGVHHVLDLFVQSSSYEGTSNSLLEAMALETAAVATTVGGTAELIEDGTHGLLIPPADAAALAAALERVLADPAATARRRRAARARVEGELSFDARMRAVEAIYGELLAGHHRRRPRPARRTAQPRQR